MPETESTAKEEGKTLKPIPELKAPLHAPSPGDDLNSGDVAITSKTAHLMRGVKRVKIRIPSTEAPGGKDDVTVNINGYLFQIKRDEDIEVPEAVLKVLDNAVMTHYKQKKREGGEGYEMVPMKVMRFPYQRIA